VGHDNDLKKIGVLTNNIIVVTDSLNNRTNFNYDARSRLISEVNALNKTRSYIYNAVITLTSRTDRLNRTIQFEYDDLNRLKKETWVGTTQQVNLVYDLVGNLQSITDLFSTLTYAYDNQNRVKTVNNTGTPNFPAVILTQTYDTNSNQLKLTDTINAQLKGTEAYTYDAINRLTQVTQTGIGVVNKRANFTYNPIYQMETLKRYADLTGTLLVATSTYSYDPMSRLTQLAHTQGATPTSLNTYTYGYDAASRIIQMTSVDGTNTYSYDNTDQLTAATYSGQSNETYGYDLNGNRTNAGYQTTSNNRLQTDGTYNYTYDDEGNLTQRTTIATNEGTEYTWDYRNRLTQVTVKNAAQTNIKQVNFTYDALNRRIEKKVDPDGSGPNPSTIERFIYDRDHIKLVFNGSNTLIRRYLHGPNIDQILADEDVVPKQISWPLSDHQGTVRDWVNNSGVIQNHIRYDSFGKIVSQTAPASTPRFAYTGREWDGEIGLYFYRARYYDAIVGRFIGEDPIGFSAGDANLYRYVSNEPTWFVDPFGLAQGMHDGEYNTLDRLCDSSKDCNKLLDAIERIKDSISFRESDIERSLLGGGERAKRAGSHKQRVSKEKLLRNKCINRANNFCPEGRRPKDKVPNIPRKPGPNCKPEEKPKEPPILQPKPQRMPSFPQIDFSPICPIIRWILPHREGV
jgi:RHS repeat-associated protein